MFLWVLTHVLVNEFFFVLEGLCVYVYLVVWKKKMKDRKQKSFLAMTDKINANPLYSPQNLNSPKLSKFQF